MSSRVDLTHRCTVERLSGSANSWGTDVSYTPHLTGQLCRAWEVSSSLLIAPGELVDVMLLHIAFPPGTDITTADRVGDITFRGTVIYAGPQTIDNVQWYPDRVEATVRRPL